MDKQASKVRFNFEQKGRHEKAPVKRISGGTKGRKKVSKEGNEQTSGAGGDLLSRSGL